MNNFIIPAQVDLHKFGATTSSKSTIPAIQYDYHIKNLATRNAVFFWLYDKGYNYLPILDANIEEDIKNAILVESIKRILLNRRPVLAVLHKWSYPVTDSKIVSRKILCSILKTELRFPANVYRDFTWNIMPLKPLWQNWDEVIKVGRAKDIEKAKQEADSASHEYGYWCLDFSEKEHLDNGPLPTTWNI